MNGRIRPFGIGEQVLKLCEREHATLPIAPGDKGFHTDGCGTWTSDLSRITASRSAIWRRHIHLGTDVAPGTWRSSDGAGCYWERLRGFHGTFDDIITNDFTNSRATVTISGNDRGFHADEACGTWTKIG